MKQNSENMTATEKSVTARRAFLKAGAALLAAGVSGRAFATAPSVGALERKLDFYNTHTDEQLSVVYWADGAYQPEGLTDIYRVLRDYRTGDVSPISSRLLDLLHTLSTSLDARQPFHVISGYRSPTTNAMLAEKSNGVAKHSLHMEGLAIDIRLPGRELADVRRAAIALGYGGVGYYPASDFVHVDVGRVRTW
ncbi:MAG TPA: DUF882 domain-containing protein [Methylophilaceae bacterium]|nr:DUF882 domain-containing protein [Methylophilaceae bacterium]HQR61200.1 DUF882 domain-containing protein [Methylophilaceae bacterium]